MARGSNRRSGRLFLRASVLVAASCLLVPGFTARRLLAQEPDEEGPDERARKLVELLQALEEGSGDTARVLDGIDLERASPDLKKLARTLRETRVDLVLEKQGVEATLDLLHQVSGVNFIITPRARAALKAAGTELTLALRGLTVENALNLLLLQLGDYRFTVRYGAVLLVLKEEYQTPKTMRIYEVTDIIRRPRNFPAPTLALPEPRERK
jgi:hypothetical protein